VVVFAKDRPENHCDVDNSESEISTRLAMAERLQERMPAAKFKYAIATPEVGIKNGRQEKGQVKQA
jgi:hypothetical protein